MPALPSVPEVVRIDLSYSWSSDPHLANRTFWKYTGGAPSNGDMTSLATALAANWPGIFAGYTSTAVALTGVKCTDLSSPSGGVGEWAGSHAGTHAGQPLSVNDCFVINFQIARRYRGGKPKTFNPFGIASDMATDQTWGSALVTDIEAAWAAWSGDITGAVVGTTTMGAQCNVSYYHGFASVQNPVTLRWRNIPTPRSAPLVDIVAGYTGNPIIGSQRRRLRV